MHTDDTESESADLVGQSTGAHSLSLCGQGEGKAWKQDRARFPSVNDGKKQRLETPKPEGDVDGVYVDYAIVIGPKGGKRKVLAGIMPAHEMGLSRHNLKAAYEEFAKTCQDPEMRRYAEIQALAKTPQADGSGNRFSAWRDRPKPVRKTQDPAVGTYVAAEPTYTHGPDCLCFPCLAKRA